MTITATLANLEMTLNGWACYGIEWRGSYTFIGAAPFAELNAIKDARQNSEFRRLLWDQHFTIHHISNHATQPEAEAYRDALIKQFKSHCNLHGTCVIPKRGAKVRNIATGATYANATDAAKDLGVSRQAMSQHLNNRDVYPTIRGCAYERVL